MHVISSPRPGNPSTRRTWIILVVCALMALPALAGSASARVYFGVGVGVPLYGGPVYVPPPYGYYRPPVYVAPPVYVVPPLYAAPPIYSVPPGYVAPSPPYPPPGFIVPPGFNGPNVAQAQYCDAGAYRCPMEQPSSPGAGCHCPGNNGQRVTGQVR